MSSNLATYNIILDKINTKNYLTPLLNTFQVLNYNNIDYIEEEDLEQVNGEIIKVFVNYQVPTYQTQEQIISAFRQTLLGKHTQFKL